MYWQILAHGHSSALVQLVTVVSILKGAIFCRNAAQQVNEWRSALSMQKGPTQPALGPTQPAPIGSHEPMKPELTSMSTWHSNSTMLQRNEGSIEQPKVASPVMCNNEQTLQISTEVAEDLVSFETAQHPAFTLESPSTLSYPSLPFTPKCNSTNQDDEEPILLV